jgi:hypothetical protein
LCIPDAHFKKEDAMKDVRLVVKKIQSLRQLQQSMLNLELAQFLNWHK